MAAVTTGSIIRYIVIDSRARWVRVLVVAFRNVPVDTDIKRRYRLFLFVLFAIGVVPIDVRNGVFLLVVGVYCLLI
jgi:hypothetical protein